MTDTEATMEPKNATQRERLGAWFARWPVGARLVAAAVVAAILFYPWAFSFIIAWAVYSSCFIECTGDPQPLAGIGLMLIPAIVFGLWAMMVAWAFDASHVATRTFLIGFGVVFGGGLILFVSNA